MKYSNYDIYLRETVRLTDLNGNEWEKYASIYVNIDWLQKQLFTGMGMTVLQVLEYSKEISRGGVLF